MDKNIRKRSSQCRLHRSLTAPTSFEEELQKPKNRAPLWFLSLSVQMGGFVVAQTDRLAIPRVRVKAEFVDFVRFCGVSAGLALYRDLNIFLLSRLVRCRVSLNRYIKYYFISII
jgi:hypothetical protein